MTKLEEIGKILWSLVEKSVKFRQNLRIFHPYSAKNFPNLNFCQGGGGTRILVKYSPVIITLFWDLKKLFLIADKRVD